MDERQRRREGSQRAREARERRDQAKKKRQTRTQLIAGGIGLLAVIGIVTGAVFASRAPEVGEAVQQLPATHATPYEYNSRPPTSGNHDPRWYGQYGYSGNPLAPQHAVHNMEHGSVVIWHQPGDPELAAQVNRLVGQLGQRCLIAGPYSDMDARVAATAWGRILLLDEFDGDQLGDFVDAYRGKRGPEAGTCQNDAAQGIPR